jgi:hypothetical protein
MDRVVNEVSSKRTDAMPPYIDDIIEDSEFRDMALVPVAS